MSDSGHLFAIRGYMKSGTNWLSNLLNLHADVSCAGEFHWERVLEPFAANMVRLEKTDNFPGLQEFARDQMHRTVRQIIKAANRPDAIWFGDRTPGLIEAAWFPPAKYFDLVRDGRDVLVSRAFHQLRRPQGFVLYETDEILQRNLANYQKDPNCFQQSPHQLLESEALVRQTAQSWTQTLRHNKQAAAELGDSVCRVVYEELHRDTEKVRGELYRFLDLDPANAKPLDRRTSPGFAKERPDHFYRKGSVGDWQIYFTPQVTAWFYEEAENELRELGYLE